MRKILVCLVLLGEVAIAGCKWSDPGTSSATRNPTDEVRAAFTQKNFGQAAELAAKDAEANPRNSELRLLQAKAEAQLGNGGNAARAFAQAVDLGLPDAAGAASDSAFDPVRQDPAFRGVVAKLEPHPSVISAQAPEGAPSVEIGADGSVRAGDVRLPADQ